MGSMTFTEKILILSMAFLKLHYTFGFDSCYHHRLLHRSAIRTLLQHNVVKNEQGIEIETKQVKLSSNDNLVEVIICNSSRKKSSLDNISSFVKNGNPSTNCDGKAPLVFIHGSFHASWCWAEHYFIHFASLGYPCYALSLRGTGGTFAGEGISKVKIDDHVEDIRAFIKFVKALEDGGRDPVLIAHSFGGLALMKYLETSFLDNNGKEIDSGLPLEGVILLCSVPPSGNAYMTLRFLTRSLSDSYKIVVGLAAKRCITNAALCRTLFFQGKQEKDGNGKVIRDDYGISDMDLKRYQGYFKRDTDAIIDLNDLSKKLPSAHVDSYGKATFVEKLPSALVVGAEDDFIVDKEGIDETARYFGVNPVFVDSPHDVMLGRKWENCAIVIQKWLEKSSKNT